MSIYDWQFDDGNALEVEAEGKVVRLSIENDYEKINFTFNAPGDFAGFVATLITLAKDVYGVDFQEILNVKE